MSRIEKLIDHLFLNKRWSVHVLYWCFALGLYVLFFGRENSNYLQTLFFVGSLMPIIIGTTYFLNYCLVPRYLLKDRYLRFIIYFIYSLIGAIFLELLISLLTFVLFAEVNMRNMTPASTDTFFLLTSTLMVVFLGMSVKLLLHYRKSKENYEKLQKENITAELKFLKAQLNPHFLFNTLNNLYFLTNEKSDRAPSAVLHLSEILDYVLNTSRVDFVPLEREWQQVQNYIALESLRYEDRLTVSVQMEGNPEEKEIAPMILLNLVENAFKHGVMGVKGRSWIDIRLNITDQALAINIANSQRPKPGGHGIGLKNLRDQLQLTYHDNFKLLIREDHPDEFAVNLTISV
jgi:sensor histidine kinase YesM